LITLWLHESREAFEPQVREISMSNEKSGPQYGRVDRVVEPQKRSRNILLRPLMVRYKLRMGMLVNLHHAIF
jgi:hypothetical protein